jgi:GWxTD domain-containing protein
VPNHAGAYWLKSDGRVTKNCIEIAGETLPPGHFATRVQLAHHEDILTLERPFDWYWEGVPKIFSNIDEAIDAMAYIASKEEIKKLKKMAEPERHAEYLKFWEKRDPTPGTAENELRLEYYGRINFANEHFYGYKKSGWKTDMGWAYVKLGSPDSIDRDPFSQRMITSFGRGRAIKALEVWSYYSYNRQLIFVDENGLGEYRLDNPETLYEIIR